MHPLHRTALAVATLSVARLAFAGETTEPAEPAVEAVASLRLSGFGTIGVTHISATQPFGFRREVNQPPNEGGTRGDTDTRLGLQANYTVNEQIELVGQVLLKRRVPQSPAADSVEWAFAAYRPAPDWVVRVGRMGPEPFLLSDYRSVGFAYPWVRPNVEFYAAQPVYSIEGIDITKTWDLDDVQWRGRVFAGQGHSRSPSVDDQPNLKVKFGGIFIATLTRQSGGLQLRAAVARLRFDLGDQPWKSRLREGLAQVEALPIGSIAAEAAKLSSGLDPNSTVARYAALGASYESGDWVASAEAQRLRGDAVFALIDSGYVSIGRRFGAFTAYGMLGAARTPRDAPEAPQWAGQLAPIVGQAVAANLQAVGSAAVYASAAARVDQRSLSGGIRWDLHPQLALKLQWDHFDIRRNGSLLWGTRNLDATSANVVTAALDFVF